MAALTGRRILITRPAHQADELARRLEDLGAVVHHVPVIAIREPASYEPLDRALRTLDAYNWVVFTSQNAVRVTCDRLAHLGLSPSVLRELRVASIGPATSRLLREIGVQPFAEPPEACSESLVDALGRFDLQGARVLLPRAEEARDVLPAGLRALGAEVDVVVAYRTEVAWDQRDRLLAVFREGVDAVTLTSPSTVQALVRLLAGIPLPDGARVVCIGPVTAAACLRAGLRVDAQAPMYTAEGLVRALRTLFEGSG